MLAKIRSHLNRRNLLNLFAVIIIAYIGLATVRVIGRNYNLQREVDTLRREIETVKLKNRELEYQIAYFHTDAFADKEARDKLGLRAPGENVVIYPSRIPKEVDLGQTVKPTELTLEVALDNLEQWLYFLFKKDPR